MPSFNLFSFRGRWLLLLTVALLAPDSIGAASFIDTLPKRSVVLDGYARSETERRLAGLDLHHIEGIWQFTSDGVIVAIERIPRTVSGFQSACYRMVLLASPNRSLRPGTLAGHVSPTAKSGIYEARIYTTVVGSSLIAPRRFTLKLDDTDRQLVFNKHKSKFSVNLWRVLPYMWRHTVTRNYEPAGYRGCVRVFPEPELPLEPRYL